MLTLILLVVLGGGVGMLAVSMAERKPATNDPDLRRAQATDEAAPAEAHVPRPEPVPAPVTAAAPADRPPPAPRRGVGPERRAHRGSVPAAQTAVEGPLGDLARPSLPRRVLSFVGIAVIVIAVAVGIAAVLGAIVGGAAELLGNAIG